MAARASRGFTLLEVVIAFAILAVTLAVIFRTFGSGAAGARRADQYTTATVLAESTLAGVGVDTPLSPGAAGGTYETRYRWRRQISAVDVPARTVNAHPGLGLYKVVVTVSWRDKTRPGLVTLTSYRAAASQ